MKWGFHSIFLLPFPPLLHKAHLFHDTLEDFPNLRSRLWKELKGLQLKAAEKPPPFSLPACKKVWIHLLVSRMMYCRGSCRMLYWCCQDTWPFEGRKKHRRNILAFQYLNFQTQLKQNESHRQHPYFGERNPLVKYRSITHPGNNPLYLDDLQTNPKVINNQQNQTRERLTCKMQINN